MWHSLSSQRMAVEEIGIIPQKYEGQFCPDTPGCKAYYCLFPVTLKACYETFEPLV